MQVFQNLDHIPAAAQNAVMVIGNFDGLHKGHQSLILHAKEEAKKHNLPCGLLTFSPHPRLFFQPDCAPFLLTNLDQKLDLLKPLDLDFIGVESFDTDFSLFSPKDFVEKILVQKYKVKTCIVGENFHFGHKKQGCITDLKRFGQDYGFSVFDMALQKQNHDAQRIYSSTQARAAIAEADFKTATDILGWDWFIRSPVIKGDQRGRALGYPTANQSVDHSILPPYGIYAVRASIDHGQTWYHAVANLGIRPMFAVDDPLLETHIFDFDQDIYGHVLDVQPVAFLRAEMTFDTLDDLVTQMDRDSQHAREILTLKYPHDNNVTSKAQTHAS